jgi:signal transduction histidine kinase
VRPRSTDLALAGVGAVALVADSSTRSLGACVLAIAAASPLAWRTRAPLPALIAVAAGALACAAVLSAGWAATGVVLVELYTVALVGDRRRSLVVAALAAIVVVVAIILIDDQLEPTGAALRVVLVLAAVAAGETRRVRGALREAAREREEREEREREEQAALRAAEARRRIAQELHDTLAHSLVAINVRASVAVDLCDSEDPFMALEEVKRVSVEALSDLRATLSLLREPDDGAPTAPSPDLQALPDLVRHVNAAGLQADLDLRINGHVVPSSVAAAAYRIVQEALTNVLRHADASRAHVRVLALDDALDIEISDDGRADVADPPSGFGLQGMVERSEALGGHVDAGAEPGGGWRVHAQLPLGT